MAQHKVQLNSLSKARPEKSVGKFYIHPLLFFVLLTIGYMFYLSKKAEREILFSFTLNGVLIQKGYPHWTETFFLVLVAAIVILAILKILTMLI